MLLADLFNNNERRTIMSSLTRWDPLAELIALQKQFFGDDWLSSPKGVNIPTTDVYKKDNRLIVEAHLPNFEQKDINIELEDDALVISAERHEKEEDKEKQFVIRESSSSFYRRIALPKRADKEKIEAQLNDGVLRVAVSITPLPEPKKIAIASKNSKK
jgi:HSP20 family protein